MKQNDDGKNCRRRRKHIIEERRHSEKDSEQDRKREVLEKKLRETEKRTHLAEGNTERKVKNAKTMDNDRYGVNTKALFPEQSYHCPGFPGILDLAVFRIIKILL